MLEVRVPLYTEPHGGGQVIFEHSAYVGLDVHKETIAVAVAVAGREETVYPGFDTT